VVKTCRDNFGKQFAVKILRNDDDEYRELARKEYQLLKELSHDYIGKMFKLFSNTRKATLYFVMEYCKGPTLMEYVKEKGRLSPEESVLIFKKLLKAV
jgi:serine/threonine-protein kinase